MEDLPSDLMETGQANTSDSEESSYPGTPDWTKMPDLSDMCYEHPEQELRLVFQSPSADPAAKLRAAVGILVFRLQDQSDIFNDLRRNLVSREAQLNLAANKGMFRELADLVFNYASALDDKLERISESVRRFSERKPGQHLVDRTPELDNVECPFCRAEYDDWEKPKRVPVCGHALCARCLEKAWRKEKCWTCQTWLVVDSDVEVEMDG